MDSKAVIRKINGLNSPTTLKRWRRMAEHLTGVTFQKDIGNMFHFTQEDIMKFQKVADTKAEKGLERAILDAFLKESEPHISLNERICLLENLVADLQQEVVFKDKRNQSFHASFKGQLNQLYERINLMEKQPKINKLLAKKY